MGFFEDINENSSTNSLWCEKYRPVELEHYIGNEHLKEKVGDYISTGDVPHLLLFGKESVIILLSTRVMKIMWRP